MRVKYNTLFIDIPSATDATAEETQTTWNQFLNYIFTKLCYNGAPLDLDYVTSMGPTMVFAPFITEGEPYSAGGMALMVNSNTDSSDDEDWYIYLDIMSWGPGHFNGFGPFP